MMKRKSGVHAVTNDFFGVDQLTSNNNVLFNIGSALSNVNDRNNKKLRFTSNFESEMNAAVNPMLNSHLISGFNT